MFLSKMEVFGFGGLKLASRSPIGLGVGARRHLQPAAVLAQARAHLNGAVERPGRFWAWHLYHHSIGIDSFSIIFNHRSFQKPDPCSLHFRRFLETRIPGKVGKVPPESHEPSANHNAQELGLLASCYMLAPEMAKASPESQLETRPRRSWRRSPSRKTMGLDTVPLQAFICFPEPSNLSGRENLKCKTNWAQPRQHKASHGHAFSAHLRAVQVVPPARPIHCHLHGRAEPRHDPMNQTPSLRGINVPTAAVVAEAHDASQAAGFGPAAWEAAPNIC